MNAQEIINYIATAPKKTPVKIYVNLREPVDFASCGAKVFGEGLSLVVFGNWADLEPVVTANAAAIADIIIENDRRNSGVPLLDIRNIRARIEQHLRTFRRDSIALGRIFPVDDAGVNGIQFL
mgnify:CR=1 FL=1